MVKTPAKPKAAAKSCAAPKIRSRQEMDARAALARIERREQYKVLQGAIGAPLAAADVAFRCGRQGGELSAGGVPAALDRVPADLLYKRLCELGSLEMQVRDQMCRVADVLLEEGFLTITGTSDDEDEDDEQC
eukprot:s3791_g8.t1